LITLALQHWHIFERIYYDAGAHSRLIRLTNRNLK
jgi:hypothetical protein